MTDKVIGQPVDSEPALRPRKNTRLEGSIVTLVPLDPDAHLDHLYDNLCGPDRAQFWPLISYGPFDNRDQFHAYLVSQQRADDRVIFTIQDNVSGTFVGIAGFKEIQPEHRGIMIGPVNFSGKLQRTTGATETVYLMARHAFADLRYLRVEWNCHALNEPSHRAARRLGFRHEGVLKKKIVFDGLIHDASWYSMTDDEWPLRRTAFETWLKPNNFDAQGVQIQSLSKLNKQFDENNNLSR